MGKEEIKQQDINNTAWKAHLEEYHKRFGGDATRIRRRLERERSVLPEGAGFYELYEKRDEANIGANPPFSLDKWGGRSHG